MGLAGSLLLGCTSSSGPAGTPAQVRVLATAVADEPLAVSVSALRPDQQVVVVVRATDGKEVEWESRTPATADSRGAVELGATAGRTTELAWRMQPLEAAVDLTAFFWPAAAVSFQIAVEDDAGRVLGTATQQRRLQVRPSAGIQLTLAADGLDALYSKPEGVGPDGAPAVLVLGGSEGGQPYPLNGAVLAGRGHHVLELAYWDRPGLPARLADVPLEYFERALLWLREQPGVDPDLVVVRGVSRGGELALLLGATYPSLIAGVIAGVPSSVVNCSFPACIGPAWTRAGRPVPYTTAFNDLEPPEGAAVEIPVERIRGPVLVNCGGRDDIWSSCDFLDAIVARRKAAGLSTLAARYPEAGHGVGMDIPGEPRSPQGPTYAADRAAVEDMHQRELALLAALR